MTDWNFIAPVSAFAARKARQQAQIAATPEPVKPPSAVETTEEPPSKKARTSPEEDTPSQSVSPADRVQTRRSSRRKAEPSEIEKTPRRKTKTTPATPPEHLTDGTVERESGIRTPVEEVSEPEGNDVPLDDADRYGHLPCPHIGSVY